ncbi:transcription regulator [Echinococcus multilocularis]|uniref:Transcription regulator n=1 Tax=Echinococcus multilocularis TaxID=6211 RepID=A0A087VY58_ECHMU|nr:transcription regulator [Echinococcus multilocularis]
MTTTEDSVRQRISVLNPLHLGITDFSDGCGLKLDVLVVSDQFEGKTLLQRHRMVNSLLSEEMKKIHALTLTTLTPKQWSEKQ